MLRVLHLMRGFFGTGRRTANAEGHLPVVEQWRLRVTDRSDPGGAARKGSGRQGRAPARPDRPQLGDPVRIFIVLAFTGTLSVATAVRQDVRTMLIAAIG